MLDPALRLSAPLSVWVVSDGRAGIENQALGLAEAVQRLTPADITIKQIRWRPAFDWLPVGLKRPDMLDPASAPLDPPWPDLWIAAGRATLPLSLGVRRWSGGRTFVVQTQDPRLPPSRFDMVVAPAHDGLSGDNVFEITGSPHRITPARIGEAASAFAARIDPLPHPRVAVLVGGRSKTFDLPRGHAEALADSIAAAVGSGSVMLTFSRRTPNDARAAMTRRLARLPGMIWDGAGPNPLFAFLDAADHILVTEDSANMAAEAASTGKPVHVLPMLLRPGRSGGKFARLHADLAAHGAARPFDGTLPSWAYEPLAETDRAARAVLEAMQARPPAPR